MEEKRYGKPRREKTSFRSKKYSENKPVEGESRFKRDSESRHKDSGERSDYSERGKKKFDKPFKKEESKFKPGRKFDDNRSGRDTRGKKYGSDDARPRFGRETESRNRDNDRRSENPERGKRNFDRPFKREESKFKPGRKFDDNRSSRDTREKKYGSDDARPRFGRETESRNRNNDERSENPERGKRTFDKPFQKTQSKFKSTKRFDDNRSNRDSNRKKYESDDFKPRFKRDSDFSEDADKSEYSEKRFEERGADRDTLKKSHYSKKKQLEHAKKVGPVDGILRLNKYISNTGTCSRREADKLIEEGRITVNGQVITEVGTKVNLADVVCMDGEVLQTEAKVYLVLNKPKDFVTTLDDPIGRKTVLDLIKHACKERVYPVGRLDRMTTGVLLFTNDGELTKKLTHPSYNKKKIYHVFLDKPVTKEDMYQISEGLELEDGLIKADAVSYADPSDKKQVGIEIHSGKNRIVRRIFEHLGYEVEKLDRVFFAGITKKNIPRGKWRFLTDEEVRMLNHF